MAFLQLLLEVRRQQSAQEVLVQWNNAMVAVLFPAAICTHSAYLDLPAIIARSQFDDLHEIAVCALVGFGLLVHETVERGAISLDKLVRTVGGRVVANDDFDAAAIIPLRQDAVEKDLEIRTSIIGRDTDRKAHDDPLVSGRGGMRMAQAAARQDPCHRQKKAERQSDDHAGQAKEMGSRDLKSDTDG